MWAVSHYMSKEMSDLEKEVLSLKKELNKVKTENKFSRGALIRISEVVHEYYFSGGRYGSPMSREDVKTIAQILEECGL